MWTHLHTLIAKKIAHATVHNAAYRLHVDLNASPHADEDTMGNTKAKQIEEEDPNYGISIDLIHAPTAVAGSTFALVFLIFLFCMILCCCRPSLTRFCFTRVFKDAHLHLPTHQPQRQQQEQAIISESTAFPIYAGHLSAPARQASPSHVVQLEAAPTYNPPPAIAYRPILASPRPINTTTRRIEDVTAAEERDPTINL